MDLQKLKFWKKEDSLDMSDLDFDRGFPKEHMQVNEPIMPQQEFPQTGPSPNIPSFQVRELPQEMPMHAAGQNRDMELISAKLDTLKSMLENINTRLQNIEETAKQKKQQQW